MSEVLNLRKLELKAWTTVFQDGLYDLFLGWLLLWMGIISLLTNTNLSHLAIIAINIGGYSLTVFLLFLAKRYITLPRTGRVQFGRPRITKIAITGMITFILVITANVLTFLAIYGEKNPFGDTPSPLLIPLLVSLFLLLLFGLPAFFLAYKRLFVIAILFASFPISEVVFREFWGINLGFFSYAIPAAIVIMIGFFVLRRFLKQHPIPEIPAGVIDHE